MERILQICHNEGTINLDEVEIGDDCLEIDGVLEVIHLKKFISHQDDDTSPVQSLWSCALPLRIWLEARGIGRTACTSWTQGWNSSAP